MLFDCRYQTADRRDRIIGSLLRVFFTLSQAMGDSGSDSDEDVFIENGDQRKTLSVAEANDADVVRTRFCLDSKPAYVLWGKKDKRVDFGNLKANTIYKLKEYSEVLEPDVYIEKGEERQTFPSAEANNAKTVQRYFSLDHEPACVFSAKTGKRVNFGGLRGGFTYKLEEGKTIPDQDRHTQNALMMANAVYQEDPAKYLSSSSQYHTINSVCAVSSYSTQGVMLAVGKVNDENVLYTAFRGTKTWDDAMADADIEQSHRDDIPGGTFHSGFERNSKVLPLKQMLYCAEQNDCQTIVLCGHSLGGAVSAISAIQLMMHFRGDSATSIFNITFGAPFFANEAVRLFCHRERFDQQMLHYSGHHDIVPGILSLGHTLSELKKRTRSGLNEATGTLHV